MTDTIYESFFECKDGSKIPLLKSKKTLESRYNPQKEALNTINSFVQNYTFFLILGGGSVILIRELLKAKKNIKILALEKSKDDFDFLLSKKEFEGILTDKNVKLCTLENLKETLISNYLPAKYDEMKIIENQNWLIENKYFIPLFQKEISESLDIIKADYSVQSHFGKIWLDNFFNNLKFLEKHQNQINVKIDNYSKAIIVAAGPSLDEKIKEIKNLQNNYCIIATDTSYPTLIKNGIRVDFAISLDGQFVSENHFINVKKEKTVFAFDITGNTSAIKHLSLIGNNIIFFTSANPLSQMLNIYLKEKLVSLTAGAGTVTMAALDFVVKSGFEEIKIYGADFSYSRGKAYTKGTYLDSLYNIKSNRISNTESDFTKLLYRTELIKSEKNKITTPVLSGYKSSLESYLIHKKLIFTHIDEIYKIENQKSNKNPTQNLNFKKDNFLNFLNNLDEKDKEVIYLPFIAWLRKNGRYSSKDFYDFLKLAQSYVVRYN